MSNKRIKKQIAPQAYLLKALSIIEKKSLRAKNLNWEKVEKESIDLAKDAETIAQTYPAIVYALKALGDNHSFLVAARGQKIIGANPSAHAQPLPRRGTNKLINTAHGKQLGLLVVREVSAASYRPLVAYAKKIRDDIARFRQEGAQGWLVDHRNNVGGNMWPMLLGVGPILGCGKIGSFESDKISTAWFYEKGQVGVVLSGKKKQPTLRITDQVYDSKCFEPVAVLINETTASSGEAVAIAFKGRPNTAFFGKHTSGLSTCNTTIRLTDGARMYLTTSIDADRNSNLYENGLEPDFLIDTSKESKISDSTLEAAVNWVENKILSLEFDVL